MPILALNVQWQCEFVCVVFSDGKTGTFANASSASPDAKPFIVTFGKSKKWLCEVPTL